eukprot:ANDGO_06557.mRNA.1 hypothetical protein
MEDRFHRQHAAIPVQRFDPYEGPPQYERMTATPHFSRYSQSGEEAPAPFLGTSRSGSNNAVFAATPTQTRLHAPHPMEASKAMPSRVAFSPAPSPRQTTAAGARNPLEPQLFSVQTSSFGGGGPKRNPLEQQQSQKPGPQLGRHPASGASGTPRSTYAPGIPSGSLTPRARPVQVATPSAADNWQAVSRSELPLPKEPTKGGPARSLIFPDGAKRAKNAGRNKEDADGYDSMKSSRSDGEPQIGERAAKRYKEGPILETHDYTVPK